MGKIISIPKELSKKDYEKLLKKQKVSSDDVLRWTNEAKFLFRKGKLPKLNF